MNKQEIRIRQSIVDKLAGLVARREADRKKRRLKLDDPVTESVKTIARGIATGAY